MAIKKQTWFVAAFLSVAYILMMFTNAKYRHALESCPESWLESNARLAVTEVEIIQRVQRDLKKGDTQSAEKYLKLKYGYQIKLLKRAAECDEVTEELCEQASEMLARIEECSSLEDNQEAEEE